MTERTRPSAQPQPMLAVSDVEKASKWYQQVLAGVSGHGGPEYERLLVDDVLVLQLHQIDVEHHHGPFGDATQPLGNGMAVWFEVDDFDAAVDRVRRASAQIVTDVHHNPNAGHREIWLRDLDGYLVVLAGS
ncbi:MAG: VOC family protein [Propionibacteriales bacterium]|nr:VOC family protein [Propionibacteriales bacterium]